MERHPVELVIEMADAAIVAEDFDALMEFYAEDAMLVVRPGKIARGRSEIRAASEAIAAPRVNGCVRSTTPTVTSCFFSPGEPAFCCGAPWTRAQ